MKKILVYLSVFLVFAEIVNAQQTTGTDTARRRQQAAGADTTRRRYPPAPVGTITPTRETPVHDPVMIKQGDKYYLFCTGSGISVFSSNDMKTWRKEAPVFSKTPDWIMKALPNSGAAVCGRPISVIITVSIICIIQFLLLERILHVLVWQ